MANHNSLTGTALHVPFHYIQTSDPGAVGAGKYWLNTTSAPYILSVRNAGDTAWVTVGASGGGGGSGTVTSVATGNGLTGGPITATGTVDLSLNASGGLSKTLGAGGELGIAAGGVTNAMLAGSIAYTKLVGTDIVTLGTVTSGGLGTGAVLRGVTTTLGSDATGDIYYRNSGGVLTRLGIGSSTQVLTVTGGLPVWAAAAGGGGGVALGDSPTWTGVHTFTPAARTSGVAPYLKITTPADTAQTLNTEFPGIVFGGDSSFATVTRTGADGTTYATQREYVFVHPTYAFAGATTVTTAATVAITAPPIAGTSATLTNKYALMVGVPTTGDAAADNVIGCSAAAKKGLVIQQKATPSAPAFEVQGSDGTTQFAVGFGGNITSNVTAEAGTAYAFRTSYLGAVKFSISYDGSYGLGSGIAFTDALGNSTSLTNSSKHYLGVGTSPTVTGNGSSNGSIVGKDPFCKVTVGTGTTTSVVITFGLAYTTAPVVVANGETSGACCCTSTTTTATITRPAAAAFTAGEVLHVVCGGF